MSKPPLKNSQSRSPNVRAVIEKTIREHGAIDFSWEIEENGPYKGEFVAVRFVLVVGNTRLQFRMPANLLTVRGILQKQSSTRAQYSAAHKQAIQTAWANVRDWLTVQFMLLDYQQVEAAEIFLPFLIAGEHDTRSLYQIMKGHDFQLLPSHKQPVTIDRDAYMRS